MEQLKEAVPSAQLSLPHFPRLRLLCGLAVALLGTGTLVGWLAGVRALTGLGTSYMPMAPNSALAFLALGTALAAYVWLVVDTTTDVLQLADTPKSIYLPIRLAVNVLAALWIAAALWRM